MMHMVQYIYGSMRCVVHVCVDWCVVLVCLVVLAYKLKYGLEYGAQRSVGWLVG